MFKSKILSLSLLFLFIYDSCKLGAGSYANAERYELNSNESELIKSIEKFKIDNPSFKVPDYIPLNEGRENSGDNRFYYFIYFYYPLENQIILTWTRPKGKDKTTFAFVAINFGLELGNWKEINYDFSNTQNEMEKKKFEDRILNKIKIPR